MNRANDFVAYALELMQPWGKAVARRMFGGFGLYRDGVFFALVIDDTLYLKADPHSQADFERLGSARFVYAAQGRTVTLSYWRAPDECLESAPAMAHWCQLAYAAALRARSRPKTAPRGTRNRKSAGR